MAIINGSDYRALINDQEIQNEFSTSIEPDNIRITVYDDIHFYNEWSKRKGEWVNFKLKNTNINVNVCIINVILEARQENVVRIFIRLSDNPGRYKI